MPIDPISIAALATTAFGIGSKIFGSSPEDERQKRRAELRKRILQLRTSTLAEHAKQVQAGVRRINETTLSQASTSRQAAARRARALGFGGEAESFILPAEGNVLERGSEVRRDYETDAARIGADLTRSFDQAELAGEFDFANRPIEPGLSDYLIELGGAGLNYAQGQRQAEAQERTTNALLTQNRPLATGISATGEAVVPQRPSIRELSSRVTQTDPLTLSMEQFQTGLSTLERPGFRKRKRFVPQFPPQIGLY